MPTTIDLGKVKLTYRGTWSAANSYEVNDIVSSNSAVWICTQTYSTVTGNRRAPGLRDRTTAYGPALIDKTPLDTFFLTKTLVSVPVGSKFYIDGRRSPPQTGQGSQITLYRGQTYRFQTYHSSMSGVNFRFATSTDGTTYSSGVTVVGTPGISGSYVQITVPYDAPNTLYYKQDTVSGVADTGYFTIADSWEGYNYWQLVSEGLSWKGTYNNSVQYYRNDLVELGGTVYIAKADTLGKRPAMVMQNVVALTTVPGSRNPWSIFSGNGAQSDPGYGAWLPNHGPMDWPYPHHSNNNSAWYCNVQYIARNGRMYSSGPGTSGSGSMDSNQYQTNAAYEVKFYHQTWQRSRDFDPDYAPTTSGNTNGQDYQNKRTGLFNDTYGRNPLHHTPGGQEPRCIQIDGNYDGRLMLFDNGTVFAMGYGGQGQTGQGTTTSTNYGPMLVKGFEDVRIKKVARSSYGGASSTSHCAALDEEGHVWTWGYNNVGQLGTGDNSNRYVPWRIPKEWFNNQRIVDIAITGAGTGSSYARTESGEIWAWGSNNTGQLGLGDTTDRWRPNKISAWDAASNGGIVKWQVVGDSSNASFFLLDGAGYMWHAGYNGYGQAGTADTTQHNTLVRSTVAPTAGFINNFWACHSNGYTMVWQRHTNGATYFVGYNASGYYHSGVTGSNVSLSTPTLVATITNLRQVWSCWDYSTTARTVWLTDRGEIWAQGYENYSWKGNEQAGAPSTLENGSTYTPHRVALPAGTRILQLWMTSDSQSSNEYGPYLLALGDNGQVYFQGANGYGYSSPWGFRGNNWYSQSSNMRTWQPLTKGR